MPNRDLVVSIFANGAQFEEFMRVSAPNSVRYFTTTNNEMAAKRMASMTAEVLKLRELDAEYVRMGMSAKAGSAEATAANLLHQNAMRKLGETAETTGRVLERASQKALVAGRTMSMYLTVPIAAAAYEATKSAIKFQQQMELIFTQAGATQQEVNRQAPKVLQLAQSGSPVGPIKLSEGLYHFESIGLRGSEAIKALSVAAQAAGLGMADMNSVATGLGGVLITNIKLGADESVRSLDHMNQTMGIIDATIGAGNMRMEDFAAMLRTGVVPAAASAGVSLTELGSAVAVLTDRGMGAQLAGTRLRMMIAMLVDPTDKAKKSMRDLGIEPKKLADVLHEPNGLLKAMELVVAGMAHVHDKGRALADALDIFGKGRSSAGALTILQSLGAIVSSMQGKEAQISAQENTFAMKVAAYHQTAAYKISAAWASIQASFTKAGGGLGGVVAKIVQDIAFVVALFDRIPPSMQKFIGIGLLVTATFGPLLILFARITQAVLYLGTVSKIVAGIFTASSAEEAAAAEAAAAAETSVGVAATESAAAAKVAATEIAAGSAEEVAAAEAAAAAEAEVGIAAEGSAVAATAASAEIAGASAASSAAIGITAAKAGGLLSAMTALKFLGPIGLAVIISITFHKQIKDIAHFLERGIDDWAKKFHLPQPFASTEGGPTPGRIVMPGGHVPINFTKGNPSAKQVEQFAAEYGLNPGLIPVFLSLVNAESGFKQFDRPGHVTTSSSGAMGLTQLMPDTARALGVNAKNTRQNLIGGLNYFTKNLIAFTKLAKGDNQLGLELALAAYNAGTPAVMQRFKHGGIGEVFAEKSGAGTVGNYVQTILGNAGTAAASRYTGNEIQNTGSYYVQPVKEGTPVARLDQGIDFQGKPGEFVYAVGNAHIDAVKDDSGFGKAIYYTLLDGPMQGQQIYVGHAQPLVSAGQKVQRGQKIALLLKSGLGNARGMKGWTEVGFAKGGVPVSHSASDIQSAEQFQAFLAGNVTPITPDNNPMNAYINLARRHADDKKKSGLALLSEKLQKEYYTDSAKTATLAGKKEFAETLKDAIAYLENKKQTVKVLREEAVLKHQLHTTEKGINKEQSGLALLSKHLQRQFFINEGKAALTLSGKEKFAETLKNAIDYLEAKKQTIAVLHEEDILKGKLHATEKQITTEQTKQHKLLTEAAYGASERLILGMPATENGLASLGSFKIEAQKKMTAITIEAQHWGIPLSAAMKSSIAKIHLVLKQPFIPSDVRTQIGQNLDAIKQTMNTKMDAIKQALQAKAAAIKTLSERAFSEIVSAADSSFSQDTQDMVQSMQEGNAAIIKNMQDVLQTQLQDMQRAAEQAVKDLAITVSGDGFESFLYSATDALGNASLTPTEKLIKLLQQKHDDLGLAQRLIDDKSKGDLQAYHEDTYQMQLNSLQKVADLERTAADKQLQKAQDSLQLQQQQQQDAYQKEHQASIDSYAKELDIDVQAYQRQRDLQQQTMDLELQDLATRYAAGEIDAKTYADGVTKILKKNGIDVSNIAIVTGNGLVKGLKKGLDEAMKLWQQYQDALKKVKTGNQETFDVGGAIDHIEKLSHGKALSAAKAFHTTNKEIEKHLREGFNKGMAGGGGGIMHFTAAPHETHVHLHVHGHVVGSNLKKAGRELEPHVRAAMVRHQGRNRTTGVR